MFQSRSVPSSGDLAKWFAFLETAKLRAHVWSMLSNSACSARQGKLWFKWSIQSCDNNSCSRGSHKKLVWFSYHSIDLMIIWWLRRSLDYTVDLNSDSQLESLKFRPLSESVSFTISSILLVFYFQFLFLFQWFQLVLSINVSHRWRIIYREHWNSISSWF